MPWTPIYEPKEGLKYWVQKNNGDWRLNGLQDNAHKFQSFKEASEIKERMRYMEPQLKIKEV
jgi:hypothetical protein